MNYKVVPASVSVLTKFCTLIIPAAIKVAVDAYELPSTLITSKILGLAESNSVFIPYGSLISQPAFARSLLPVVKLKVTSVRV